jgi:hypothetical protein
MFVYPVILLLGGAVIFRTAVAFVNGCLGVNASSHHHPDDKELDEWIGYRQIKRSVRGIPEPGFGRAIFAVLALFVTVFFAGILIRLLFSVSFFGGRRMVEGEVLLVGTIGGILISFPVAAWVLAGILRTNFKRACQVLIVNYLTIVGLIGLVLGGIYIIR